MSDALPPEILLEGYPPPMRAIAEELRVIVRRTLPEATERVRPGWRIIGYDVAVGRRIALTCFVWPEPEHVHLGFQNGVLMRDAAGILQGAGITKLVRWVTFEPADPIDPARLEPLIHECVRIAAMSPTERRFLAGSPPSAKDRP